MTDQPTTTAPETTCLGCPGCGGPDCIQRTTEPPDPDQEPQMLVPCGLAVLNWPDHTAHSWQPQPGMDLVRCEGSTPSLYARERAAHEEHRRSLASLFDLPAHADWLTVARGVTEARQLAENMQGRAAAMETRANLATAARDEAILRAETAEATLTQVGEITSRLTAHAGGFGDALDETDRGPWGRLVMSDLFTLRAALRDDQPAATNPCAHGCRAAADQLAALDQETEAEPTPPAPPLHGPIEAAADMLLTAARALHAALGRASGEQA